MVFMIMSLEWNYCLFFNTRLDRKVDHQDAVAEKSNRGYCLAIQVQVFLVEPQSYLSPGKWKKHQRAAPVTKNKEEMMMMGKKKFENGEILIHSWIMFTVGNVDRYIERYIGRRSGRHSIDTWSPLGRLSIDTRLRLGCYSVDSRSMVGRDVCRTT